MKTSTGLMIILIAALLASASIPSPLRYTAGRAIGRPTGAAAEYVQGGDATQGWRAPGGPVFRLPHPGRLLQSWWSWQAELLESGRAQ